MSKFEKWENYVKRRDQGVVKEAKMSVGLNTHETEPSDEENVGKPLDSSFRDEAEYKKMLEFLRGKKTLPDGMVGEKPITPKEAPKGWFIVDEQTLGFWHNGSWSQDSSQMSEAIIDSEKAASELARVVGGMVIPAEEILG